MESETSTIEINKRDHTRGRLFCLVAVESISTQAVLKSLDRVRNQGFGTGTGSFVVNKDEKPKLVGVRIDTNQIDVAVALMLGLSAFIKVHATPLRIGKTKIIGFSTVYRPVQSIYEE